MSTTYGVRITDMPDLGPVTDSSSVVGEHAGSGRFGAVALRDYVGTYLKQSLPVNARDHGATGNGSTDDTAALQAAFDAAAASGGTVIIPVGTYRITDTLAIGNGAEGALSTKAGIMVIGAVPPPFPDILGAQWTPILAATPCTRIVWDGASNVGKAMIEIRGPLCSWGLRNLFLEGANKADHGLLITSAMRGDCENLTIANCLANQIYSTTRVASPGGALANAMHNSFRNIIVSVAWGRDFSCGVRLDGNASGNTCYCAFDDLFVSMASSTAITTVFGVYLKACDSNNFIGVHFLNAPSDKGCAVMYDYNGTSADWPAANTFWNADWGGLTAPVQWAGTPGSSAAFNTIAAINQCNGGHYPDPHTPNLSVVNGTVAQARLDNQTAAVPGTLLYDPPGMFGGMFECHYYLMTSNSTASGGTIGLFFSWLDGVGNGTHASATVVAGPTGGNNIHGSFSFFARDAIQFATSLAGIPAGSPVYAVQIALSRIA